MSKETKLEKKEAKAAKKAAKAEKAAQKMVAKAEKQHAKAYEKFVKETTKKNAKGEKKAASKGIAFTAAAIPSIDEFQSKSEIKAIKAADKAYASTVKKIEKKNVKLEKKCTKKGKPFVPVEIPAREEFDVQQSKKNQVVKTIILILLLWLVIYLIVMWFMYVAPTKPAVADETTAAASYDYETYSNPHEITTTPDYSIADAKLFLKQVIKDNWKTIGYSSDVSNTTISYSNKIVVVNNADCYVFTCSGKTYAVPIKLSACYVEQGGKYIPLTFNNTDVIFD